MTHRAVAVILFCLSLIGIGAGYLLLHPEIMGWCASASNTTCLSESLTLGIGKPLFWSTYLLPLLFLVLFFVRREVFSAWWKVVLPISLIALYGIATSPLFPEYYTPDRTSMTEYMVWLITIISAFVIIWKYWRLGRKGAVV